MILCNTEDFCYHISHNPFVFSAMHASVLARTQNLENPLASIPFVVTTGKRQLIQETHVILAYEDLIL